MDNVMSKTYLWMCPKHWTYITVFELFLVTLIPNVGSLTNSTLYFLLVAGDGRFILSASAGISKADELTGRNCGYQISHMIFYHISIENSIAYYINVFLYCVVFTHKCHPFFSTEFYHVCLHSCYLSNVKLPFILTKILRALSPYSSTETSTSL